MAARRGSRRSRGRHPPRQTGPFGTTLLLLLAATLDFALAGELRAQTATKERFSESLTVRERTFFVDDSVLPSLESIGRRAPSDFLVRIDGAAVEVVDPGPDDPPEVVHVIWLDTALVSAAGRARAASILAEALPEFPPGGTFELIEASPGSISAARLSRSELGARLRTIALRDAAATSPSPTTAERIAALDRLVVEMPRHEGGELGAFWLLAEAWSLEPEEVASLVRSGVDDSRAPSLLGALQRAARVLGSRGWVAFPLSAARRLPAGEHGALLDRPDDEQFLDRGTSPRYDQPNPGFLRWIFPWKRFQRTRRTPSRSFAQTLELALDMQRIPLARLARETSGAQAGDPIRIAELASRLANRRRLTVLDSSTDDGRLRQIEIDWIGGDGRALPALPWSASHAPAELGIARLLSTVESGRTHAGAPLRLRPATADGRSGGSLCFAYPGKRLALRVTTWNAGTERIEIASTTDPLQLESGCIDSPLDLTGADFVQLETPESQEWGAARLSALVEPPGNP